MLDWHYRSPDERLIAFSNAHIYGKSLLTFPGVSGPECLRHVHVPWQPDRADGEDSSNAEVLKVVELILEHAEQRPEQSLGVIAMGIKHADRIDGALRHALRDRRDLDDFFDENQPERFFVKNLERVQGDERDAIILSVGYGKGADGADGLPLRPAEPGGRRAPAQRRRHPRTTAHDRRLVVHRCRHGPRANRDAAATCCASTSGTPNRAARTSTARPPTRPRSTRSSSTSATRSTRPAYPLICQHGVGRYRIDFAAKHPDQPGRLVLAIEADGASYHSADTARDRDRLRQEQLERLGWRFHRIWSHDWFTERKHARSTRRSPPTRPPSSPAITHQPRRRSLHCSPRPYRIASPSKVRGPRPDLYPWGQIDEFTDRDLQAMVLWIESDTLLRSREDLIAAVMSELGFERRGKKIVSRIGAAIDAVRRTGN